MKLQLPVPLRYFLAGFLVLGFSQALLTPLDPDEAYYWIYAQHLDWGYFDHPPMAALWIKLGSAWIPGELGVRFATLLMMPLTLIFVWKLAGSPRKGADLNLFLLLAASMPFFHLYGFIATSDAPLLFFTAVWFWAFRRFLEKSTLGNTLLLGLMMALLLYSKYHGVLLIGFSIISNLNILRSHRFWMASVFGFMLFVPHLYWQYANGFPTFAYHLSGRDDKWELKLPLNYLLNQLLVFSPFLFPFLMRALFNNKVRSRNKVEFFQIVGFWMFFALMTFKGHVEPQWTAVLSIPAVLFLLDYTREKPQEAAMMQKMALLSIGLILIARLGVMTGVLRNKKLFGDTQWVQELYEKAQGLPLYFENSYRDASMYAFYAGESPSTFTNIDYRANQFNLLDREVAFQNRSVMIVGQKKWNCSKCKTDTLSNGHTIKLQIADSLQVSENCRIFVENIPEIWSAGALMNLQAVVLNPYPFDIILGKGNLPLTISAAFNDGEAWKQTCPLVDTGNSQLLIRSGERKKLTFSLDVPELKGNFRVAFGFRMGTLLPSVNSPLYNIIIE